MHSPGNLNGAAESPERRAEGRKKFVFLFRDLYGRNQQIGMAGIAPDNAPVGPDQGLLLGRKSRNLDWANKIQKVFVAPGSGRSRRASCSRGLKVSWALFRLAVSYKLSLR